MKKMDDEGAMCGKGIVIVALALLVVALLIAIPLVNSTLITGNDIIFGGHYEISEELEVEQEFPVGIQYPMTNGEVIAYFEHVTLGVIQGGNLKYMDVSTQEKTTIWEHNATSGLELLPKYDLEGNTLVFMVKDTNTLECLFYTYDFAEQELTNVFTASAIYTHPDWFAMKVYGDYILWGAEVSGVDIISICDIRTQNSYPVMELQSTDGNYCYGEMDIWENQVVVGVSNTTYGAGYLARANILNPHPETINWVLDPTEHSTETYQGVSMYDNRIATLVSVEGGNDRICLIENFTSQEPTVRYIDPEDDEFHRGYTERPYTYENFVMWYRYTTDYTSGWIYLHDLNLNMSWRIDTSQYSWSSSTYIPEPNMQGGIICWGEEISYVEYHIFYKTIGAYQRDIIAPKFVQAVNLNGVYLLGITATLLVGIVANEWIAEGGLPSLQRSGSKRRPPEYREL